MAISSIVMTTIGTAAPATANSWPQYDEKNQTTILSTTPRPVQIQERVRSGKVDGVCKYVMDVTVNTTDYSLFVELFNDAGRYQLPARLPDGVTLQNHSLHVARNNESFTYTQRQFTNPLASGHCPKTIANNYGERSRQSDGLPQDGRDIGAITAGLFAGFSVTILMRALMRLHQIPDTNESNAVIACVGNVVTNGVIQWYFLRSGALHAGTALSNCLVGALSGYGDDLAHWVAPYLTRLWRGLVNLPFQDLTPTVLKDFAGYFAGMRV